MLLHAASRPTDDSRGDLTDTERAILDLECHWFKHAGAKETTVHRRFGMTPTRYYQVLNALIDRPEAEAHDPMVVRRLRRLRAARLEQRSSRERHPAGSKR